MMGSVIVVLGFWFCLIVLVMFALALMLEKWDV